MKKIYLKHIHILENIVHICIINDLSYPPANNQNAFFFIYITTALFWMGGPLCLFNHGKKSPKNYWAVGISLRLQGKLGFPYNVKQLMVKYVLLC